MSSRSSYGGRYSVIERVGAGGMAEVYRARDELLGREVAIKVLSERLSRDRSFVERFRREAQSAANLTHPNIVSLFDYGADDGTYFIVMEFIDGKPLSEIIREEGRLMPERAAEIAVDVARALERAHDGGLVHRDIKSSNIMITLRGETKVTDFGIARAVGGDDQATVTQTGMVIGTAAYLSPEQAQGNPVDARSDVYSLGVVLYEMLTGRTPFQGESPLSIAYKHVREDPRPPGEINPDVPDALDAICLKALAKNPENRFSSAREMRADLERFLAGQAVHATPLMVEEDATQVAPAGGRTEVLRGTEVYPQPPPPSRAWWWVLAAVLILALFGVLAWLLADSLFGGEPVEVPRVIGMTEDDARELLEARNLDVDVERRASRRPVGEVVAQDPEAGETVQEGDAVTIIVSQGPRMTEVPEVVGLDEEEAEDVLDEARLRVGDVTEEPSDEFEEGQVISQDPEAGEEVPVRTEVDLVVSAGPEMVTVPSVVGLQEEQAVQNIEAVGLEAQVNRDAADAPEGEVVAQEPEGGTEVAAGSTVTILVSEGPEEQEMPDVRGQDADEAEAVLEQDYGLDVTQTEETQACAEPPGRVCRQEPQPGTPVSPGDSATLYVQGGGADAGGGEGLFPFGPLIAFLFAHLA